MDNRIFYGFDRTYLKSWGFNEALREVYQNFLDYGNYEEYTDDFGNNIHVTLSNTWRPETLDFLRIGNSNKNNENSIGKHGEGLKMAFLIFHRLNIKCRIITPSFIVTPGYYNESAIGECFCLEYDAHSDPDINGFSIEFTCPVIEYDQFKNNMINAGDVTFSDGQYGDIVNKDRGNVYSGRLFVCKVNNLSRSYNINPQYLPLDRDRQVPWSFDVSWATSKILNAHGKWHVRDMSFSDTAFIDDIPDEVKKQVEPKIVGNSVQFVFRDNNGVDNVISNSYIQESLKKDSTFVGLVKKLKMFIAKQLGLYDLLIEFKNKHVHGTDATADFDIILDRITSEK